MVMDVGREFHRGFAVVLRGVFFAAQDRASRTRLVDATEDCVGRRQRFEAEHPDVTITTPPTLRDLWRAVVPAGQAAGREIGMQVTAWSLCDLMVSIPTKPITGSGVCDHSDRRPRSGRRWLPWSPVGHLLLVLVVVCHGLVVLA
jgi:hypothetical protein